MFREAEYNIILLWNEIDGQFEIAHLFMKGAPVQAKVKFHAFIVQPPSSSSNEITLSPRKFRVQFQGESNFKGDDRYFTQDSDPEPLVRLGEYPFECQIEGAPAAQGKGGHTHPPGPAS